MNSDELQTAAYLQELCTSTGGDIEAQASMYDIGASIGIEKDAAGKLAEELMVQGYVELKTLSGGIGITAEGLSFLGVSAGGSSVGANRELSLSAGPVANDDDRNVVQTIIARIHEETAAIGGDYETLEQIVLDLKAIELHLLTPAPKIAVLTALFHSIADCCKGKEDFLKNSGLSAVTGGS